jgi:hypothetical protein
MAAIKNLAEILRGTAENFRARKPEERDLRLETSILCDLVTNQYWEIVRTCRDAAKEGALSIHYYWDMSDNAPGLPEKIAVAHLTDKLKEDGFKVDSNLKHTFKAASIGLDGAHRPAYCATTLALEVIW